MKRQRFGDDWLEFLIVVLLIAVVIEAMTWWLPR
jgi:hypothetical protein